MVGPASDPASYIAIVAWGEVVRLRPEIVLVVYLDDIYCSSESFLFQQYRRILGTKSKPLEGLEFTAVAKSYSFVPRCFAAEICNMFPNALIVDEKTPGATPMHQLNR